MTFCAQNSMCLKGRKLILTLTKDKKLTFDLSIINLSFTKKVGRVEQKWNRSEQLENSVQKFVHSVPPNMSNLG